MATLVDTNVLLRSLSLGHPHQPIAERALVALISANERLVIAPQNLVEFWAVATRPLAQNGLGMSTDEAEGEVAKLRGLFRVLPGGPLVLDTWQKLVGDLGVSGKQTHDAHLAAAMQVAGVAQILTFNVSDFRRYRGIVPIDPADVLVGP